MNFASVDLININGEDFVRLSAVEKVNPSITVLTVTGTEFLEWEVPNAYKDKIDSIKRTKLLFKGHHDFYIGQHLKIINE